MTSILSASIAASLPFCLCCITARGGTIASLSFLSFLELTRKFSNGSSALGHKPSHRQAAPRRPGTEESVMRKALIAILMAATAATPLAAQDNGWRGRNHDGGEQRSQRTEQRPRRADPAARARRASRSSRSSQQRVERSQGQQENRGNWGGRREQQQVQQQQIQQQQVQASSSRCAPSVTRAVTAAIGAATSSRTMPTASPRSARPRSAAPSRRSAALLPARPPRTSGATSSETLRREQDNRGWNGNRNNDNRRWDGNRNDNRGNWSGNRNGGNSWNRNWRNDNRYDWQRYRYQNRRIFSLGHYYAPYGGYGYNRLNIGIVLGEAFLRPQLLDRSGLLPFAAGASGNPVGALL